ncbi:MAG: hypothetical protein IJW29_02875 [Clostridia bacterium]|nr:hypothetical protein [Clostridia bacterium]
MSWDTVYGDLKNLAGRAADKLGQTATLATLQVKLSMAEKTLEDAYAALGKVAYEHFTDERDLSPRVSLAVSRVNDAMASVVAYKNEIARMQAGGNAKEAPKTEDV